MLHDSQSVEHGMLVLLDSLDSLFIDILLDELLGVELAGGVEVGRCLSVLLLGIGARGVEASPIVVSTV